MRIWNREQPVNTPSNCQIDLVINDLLIECQGLPRWLSICPNSAVVPSALVVLDFFQDEVVQFNHIHVLFKWHQLVVWSDGPNVLAFSLNWFAVLSMQTMRFLLFIPWVHLASKRDEQSLVGTVLTVGCLAYCENMNCSSKDTSGWDTYYIFYQRH